MLDIKFIRENAQIVKTAAKNKRADIDIDELLQADEERRRLQDELNSIQGKRKAAAKAKDIEKGKNLKESAAKVQAAFNKAEEKFLQLMRLVPNIPRNDVPVGADESANELIRQVGGKPNFVFEPKDHEELGVRLGIIDKERAAKVSGARFTYLKGDAALLQFALINYAMDILVGEGFTPVIPPHLISIEAMGKMGYLEHGGEEEIYHLKNDDAVLIGTSEQSIGPMHMNEILDENDLPIRYVGYSPCYRREAGSYGKDTKGILRLHQFDKIEMFSYTTPDKSDQEHEMLLALQERLFQGLKIPYRVMKLCTGDTGKPSARTYDLEAWVPSQNTYREVTSTSNTTDFQTRRLNIRSKIDSKNIFVHALNGTAFAIGRTIVAILENNQQKDGSVVIPDVLRPFMGGRSRIKQKK